MQEHRATQNQGYDSAEYIGELRISELWRHHLPSLISDLIWAGNFFRNKNSTLQEGYLQSYSFKTIKKIKTPTTTKPPREFPYLLHSMASKIINDMFPS